MKLIFQNNNIDITELHKCAKFNVCTKYVGNFCLNHDFCHDKMKSRHTVTEKAFENRIYCRNGWSFCPDFRPEFIL